MFTRARCSRYIHIHICMRSYTDLAVASFYSYSYYNSYVYTVYMWYFLLHLGCLHIHISCSKKQTGKYSILYTINGGCYNIQVVKQVKEGYDVMWNSETLRRIRSVSDWVYKCTIRIPESF